MHAETLTRGRRLGEILVRNKLLTVEQLEMALELQRDRGGRLGEILVELGMVTPADVAMALSLLLNLPLIDLKAHQVEPEALRLISEEMARKHTTMPLAVLDGRLVVVMSDPGNIRALEELEAQARMRVKPAVASEHDILDTIDLHYKAQEEIQRQIEQMRPSALPREEVEARITPDVIAEAPVVRAINLLVSQAVKDRASDIHIEPQEDRLRIRYRIDGILHDVLSLPLSPPAAPPPHPDRSSGTPGDYERHVPEPQGARPGSRQTARRYLRSQPRNPSPPGRRAQA